MQNLDMRFRLKRVFVRGEQAWFGFLFRLLSFLILCFILSTILITIFYGLVNPPVTPLMIKMSGEKHIDGSNYGIHKEWVKIEEISENMILAVVASEDNRFLEHHGFDMKAIEDAREHNKQSKRKHGASTISMQTAKNVFLWPNRTWTRKGFEAWFTVLIELFWSKERIMEVYLNVIETGKGMYGVEAAAQKYYKLPAAKLSRSQSAMIAAILPNPRERDPRHPTAYMYKRRSWILWNMGNIEQVKFD